MNVGCRSIAWLEDVQQLSMGMEALDDARENLDPDALRVAAAGRALRDLTLARVKREPQIAGERAHHPRRPRLQGDCI